MCILIIKKRVVISNSDALIKKNRFVRIVAFPLQLLSDFRNMLELIIQI